MAAFWKRKTEKAESMTAQTLLDFLGVSATDGKMYKAFCAREQMVVFLRRLAEKIGG